MVTADVLLGAEGPVRALSIDVEVGKIDAVIILSPHYLRHCQRHRTVL